MRKIAKITGITLAGLIATTSLIACSSTGNTTLDTEKTIESTTESTPTVVLSSDEFQITEPTRYKLTRIRNEEDGTENSIEGSYWDDLKDYILTLNPDGTGKSISFVDFLKDVNYDIEWGFEEDGTFFVNEIKDPESESEILKRWFLTGTATNDEIDIHLKYATSNTFIYEKM